VLVLLVGAAQVAVQRLDRAVGAGDGRRIQMGLIDADHAPNPSDAWQSARRRRR
jgi:hypothetical protein